MASGTDEKAKIESLTSPAAFVEGGIQDACDDACSICLEAFCESDPSALTTCKHEFHLQCILEWCQRSSQCPMCWQPISMKDPTSQELLEAVERERNIRTNQTRNTTIFHHPSLGDFDYLLLVMMLNLKSAYSSILLLLLQWEGRTKGHRGRSGSQGRPQFLVFSAHPNSPSAGTVSSSSAHGEGDNDSNPGTPLKKLATLNWTATPDRAGPSDMQSFSDSLKSRLNAVSMKYNESISKSTRGWKERLFSRNSCVADLGSEVRREVNAGIASVSRMMEHLATESSNERVTVHDPLVSTTRKPGNCARKSGCPWLRRGYPRRRPAEQARP
ncbi:hypothetical protein ACP4OV_027158 [Aristida adscensionis]